MNTELRKIVKNNIEKYFFKLINYSVFSKTVENVRKHGGIKLKLTTTEKRKNYMVFKQNDHTTVFFSESLFAIKKKKHTHE